MTFPNRHYNRVIVNSLADMPDPVGGVITLEHEKEYLLNNTIFCPYTVRFLSSPDFSATHRLSATTLGTHAWVYVGTGYAFESIYPNPGERAWTVQINDVVLLAPYGAIFNIDGLPLSVLFFNSGAIQNSVSIGIVRGISYYQFFTAVSGINQGIIIEAISDCLIANNVFLNTPNTPGCVYITINGNSGIISINNNIIRTKSNEAFLYIDPNSNVIAGKVLGTLFEPNGGFFYKTGSKNYSDPYWSFAINSYQQDSSTGGEIFLYGNIIATVLNLQDSWSLVDVTGFTAGNTERIIVSDDGVIEYTGLEAAKVYIDAVVGGSSALASHEYAIKFAILRYPNYIVTFDNTLDVVILNDHGFQNGDPVSFKKSDGILPTGLSRNNIYYVANQTQNAFQLVRVIGGAISTFTDNGSGINSINSADFHGSVVPVVASNTKISSITSSAVMFTNSLDCIVVIISNTSGAVNFIATNIYIRI